jgi:hypothetical protein
VLILGNEAGLLACRYFSMILEATSSQTSLLYHSMERSFRLSSGASVKGPFLTFTTFNLDKSAERGSAINVVARESGKMVQCLSRT